MRARQAGRHDTSEVSTRRDWFVSFGLKAHLPSVVRIEPVAGIVLVANEGTFSSFSGESSGYFPLAWNPGIMFGSISASAGGAWHSFPASVSCSPACPTARNASSVTRVNLCVGKGSRGGRTTTHGGPNAHPWRWGCTSSPVHRALRHVRSDNPNDQKRSCFDQVMTSLLSLLAVTSDSASSATVSKKISSRGRTAASPWRSNVRSSRATKVSRSPILKSTCGRYRRMGIQPEATVYVGDGGDDELAGAERVGLRACRAAWFGGR